MINLDCDGASLDAGVAATTSATVALPDYDRSALIPGVVHIGVGGFHRAHQAVYFDDLAATGERESGSGRGDPPPGTR
jgi:mannitol 2-dehydrogenase